MSEYFIRCKCYLRGWNETLKLMKCFLKTKQNLNKHQMGNMWKRKRGQPRDTLNRTLTK